MSKKLVAYFSASGVTAKVAETLAEAIGADIFEIEPKVPYTEADLNWMDKKARSTIEMNDPASRPEIAVKRDNMKDYDTIFVGFPIWWYSHEVHISNPQKHRKRFSGFAHPIRPTKLFHHPGRESPCAEEPPLPAGLYFPAGRKSPPVRIADSASHSICCGRAGQSDSSQSA